MVTNQVFEPVRQEGHSSGHCQWIPGTMIIQPSEIHLDEDDILVELTTSHVDVLKYKARIAHYMNLCDSIIECYDQR